MKSWNKNSGWLVGVKGGPSDGAFWRTWCLTGDPHIEVAMLWMRRPTDVWVNDCKTTWLDGGEYVLAETFDRKGNRKMAKASGTQVPMVHWQYREGA